MNFETVIVTFMLTADQLASQGSSLPIVGPEPALGILRRLPAEWSGAGWAGNM